MRDGHLTNGFLTQPGAIADEISGARAGLPVALLLRLRPHGLCSPARPSEDGGFDELALLLGLRDPLLSLPHLLATIQQFFPQSFIFATQALVLTFYLPRVRGR
jgi:hypothetical protein